MNSKDRLTTHAGLIALSALLAQAAHGADVESHPTLTLEGARHVAAAALDYARAHGAPGAAVAVVDDGGHPIYLARLDGTFSAGAEISIGKARTAVMFKRPTHDIEDVINKGRTAMLPVAAVTSFTPLQGGVPIVVGGQIVGGGGASNAQQDEEVAMAGAHGLESTPVTQSVQVVPADAVSRAFQEGKTGGTLVTTPGFRVNASRRDGPGEAEVHTRDTDIIYVLQGSATVVTGGQVIGAHEVSPGEIRGSAVEGGDRHQISVGDVLTIGSGVPHWFQSVTPPFRYYVIKANSGS